jgi:hypothetical protein
MAWAGWGAGPAGAGSAGGPSRWFLGVLLVASAVVTVILAMRERWLTASAGLAITVYYFARLFLGLGRRRE